MKTDTDDIVTTPKRRERTCSHHWIDPDDPPIQRAGYAPFIGPGRRQMKPGRTYVCQNCRTRLKVPEE